MDNITQIETELLPKIDAALHNRNTHIAIGLLTDAIKLLVAEHKESNAVDSTSDLNRVFLVSGGPTKEPAAKKKTPVKKVTKAAPKTATVPK